MGGSQTVGQNDPQIVSDMNREWSEDFPFPLESVVEALCLLNTLNMKDGDKLRQQRNRSIQSECLENNR